MPGGAFGLNVPLVFAMFQKTSLIPLSSNLLVEFYQQLLHPFLQVRQEAKMKRLYAVLAVVIALIALILLAGSIGIISIRL